MVRQRTPGFVLSLYVRSATLRWADRPINHEVSVRRAWDMRVARVGRDERVREIRYGKSIRCVLRRFLHQHAAWFPAEPPAQSRNAAALLRTDSEVISGDDAVPQERRQ